MRRPYNGTYPVTRHFGVYDAAYAAYPNSRHPGTDYGTPYRTPLVASQSGVVQVIDRGTAKTGRGREVVITNGNTQVKYCHMDSFDVSNGQNVTEGQLIGYVGFTGYVMDWQGNIGTVGGSHLHFEVLVNGIYVNPETQYNQGEDMVKKEDLGAIRIIMSEVEGWNGHEVHAGKYDSQILSWVGKKWTDFIWNGWNKQKKHRIHLEDELKAERAKTTSLTKQVTDLKAQLGSTEEANILGKALLPIIKALGYKK